MDSELKQYLESMEARFDTKLGAIEARIDTKLGAMEARIDHRFEATENRLVEKMRDMQTELLRGFASFSEAQTIRLRKVEADQSNLDAALSGRVNVLEGRLLQIELRLGLLGGTK
jgi:flagellar biosynthesis/type III secretory pathway protein FliH